MGTSGRGGDTVVIGGGIVGVCTALQLQRSGHDVTLIERATPGEEASGHNGGVFSVDCLPTAMPSVIRSLPHMLRDPMSPLAIRFSYLPRLAPWLVRFALNSRAKRVDEISAALNTLMSRGIDAYRPLIAGTEAGGHPREPRIPVPLPTGRLARRRAVRPGRAATPWRRVRHTRSGRARRAQPDPCRQVQQGCLL